VTNGRNRLVLLGSGTVLFFFGVGAALTYATKPRFRASTDLGRPAPRAAATNVSYVISSPGDTERIAALERTVETLKSKVEGAEPATSNPAPADPMIPKEQAVTLWEDELRAFSGEAADRSWAPWANTALREAVSVNAKQVEAEVTSVDCRTQQCAVAVRWASFELAQQNYMKVVEGVYPVNCGRGTFLPDPKDDGPYEVTVLFKCSTTWGDRGHPTNG
jgi:hypothetical protein